MVVYDFIRGDVSSRALLRILQKRDQTRPLWQPIHLSKAYTHCQSYYGDVAEQINQHALSLPCSVGIQDEDIDKVITEIKTYLQS